MLIKKENTIFSSIFLIYLSTINQSFFHNLKCKKIYLFNTLLTGL